MHPHFVIKAMLGGLLGTLVQTLLVYGVIPLLMGQSFDMAAMLEPRCVLSLLAHVLSGSVLFPLGYVAVPSHDLPGPPILKGMLWEVLLWGGMESIMAPLLGAGVFSTALGGLPAALRALLGYLVYGATLGSVVGSADPEDRCHPAPCESAVARRAWAAGRDAIRPLFGDARRSTIIAIENRDPCSRGQRQAKRFFK
jgi:hypothetical protein